MQENIQPIVEWGDYVFGRLVYLGKVKINRQGVKLREMIIHVDEAILEDYGIDIIKEGVTAKGKPGGSYVWKAYPDAFILPPKFARVGKRSETMIRILCGFDSNENTDLLLLGDSAKKEVVLLEEENQNLRANVAYLLEENRNLRALKMEDLQQQKEMRDIIETKTKVPEEFGEEGSGEPTPNPL